MKDQKITICLEGSREVIVFLTYLSARELMDQIYSIFSGEFDDNCLEVVSTNEGSKETLLIRADQIKFCRSQDFDE